MEVIDETMGSNEHNSQTIKGRRTKRPRQSSPHSMTMSTSSSNAGDTFPCTSIEFGESTEEDEDMANCLIMLAQGSNPKQIQADESGGGDERKFKDTAATATSFGKTAAPELYVYECKTCNRCFPSFQALGGHRASHKKPKPVVEEKEKMMKPPPQLELYEDDIQFNNNVIRNRVCAPIKSSKVHECSICGSEFSSGQALGGHMRRHRTSAATNVTATEDSSQEIKKERYVFALDLNLPAPEEERESKFSFVSKQPPLIYSASSLVDCHY